MAGDYYIEIYYKCTKLGNRTVMKAPPLHVLMYVQLTFTFSCQASSPRAQPLKSFKSSLLL